VRLWQWLLGGGIAAGVTLLAADAFAATPTLAATHDENRFNDALRRFKNFLAAARIDATAYMIEDEAGMRIGLRPGAKFVGEDALALPRDVSGISVTLVGWPR
jgi:hypothetical protein